MKVLLAGASGNIGGAIGAELDWTYISPAAVIGPGERTGSYRRGDDQVVVDDQVRAGSAMPTTRLPS